MTDRYLEVTFRNGKPFAAYLHLPKPANEHSVRSEEVEYGMVVDYGPKDHPIGIEMTAPDEVTIDRVNQILLRLKVPGIQEEEFLPLSHQV